VNFAFNEEQEELRRSARGFLKESSSSHAVRRAMESERGYDADVWKRIGSELGWTALTIPEAYGGLGLGTVELVALLEEMGAVLLCAPFFSTICLATNALLTAATEEQKRELLPAIAAGETTATLAYTEANGPLGRGSSSRNCARGPWWIRLGRHEDVRARRPYGGHSRRCGAP
jgi:alkylation response protein AidB-like acyl-CoA dehydrogenase